MVNGSPKPSATTKNEKATTKRVSPNRDRKKKATSFYAEKKSTSYIIATPQIPAAAQKDLPPPALDFDDLLTPELILKSYVSKKNPQTTPPASIMASVPSEDLTATKEPRPMAASKPIGILDLLSKKDNLERISHGVSQAVRETKQNSKSASIPVEMPVRPVRTPRNLSPPSTPPKKLGGSERFAGLSNSPAPSSLPLPSFSFLDQELNNGMKRDSPLMTRAPPMAYSSPTMPSQSPPSNPQLETMTSHLRKMLNITSIES